LGSALATTVEIESTFCHLGVRSLHEYDRWDNQTVDPYGDPQETDATCYINDDGEDECMYPVVWDWTAPDDGYCQTYVPTGTEQPTSNPNGRPINSNEAYRVSLGNVVDPETGEETTEPSACECDFTIIFAEGEPVTFELTPANNVYKLGQWDE
jgi:hypothetical protein